MKTGGWTLARNLTSPRPLLSILDMINIIFNVSLDTGTCNGRWTFCICVVMVALGLFGQEEMLHPDVAEEANVFSPVSMNNRLFRNRIRIRIRIRGTESVQFSSDALWPFFFFFQSYVSSHN